MKKVLILEDNTVAARHVERVVNELDVKCQIYLCSNIQRVCEENSVNN